MSKFWLVYSFRYIEIFKSSKADIKYVSKPKLQDDYNENGRRQRGSGRPRRRRPRRRGRGVGGRRGYHNQGQSGRDSKFELMSSTGAHARISSHVHYYSCSEMNICSFKYVGQTLLNKAFTPIGPMFFEHPTCFCAPSLIWKTSLEETGLTEKVEDRILAKGNDGGKKIAS